MNLLRAASIVSLLTLVSRITGLVREQMVASLFGANAMTDAFNVAFRIPNLLRRLFAEGAFSQAFVPLLATTRAERGDEATQALIDAAATLLAWALLATCALGIFAAPALVWLLASGMEGEGHDAAVVMTRFMFPYIGLISMVSLAAGVLNTWKKFVVPAATPVLLNLSWIAAGWWLSPYMPGWGLPPIYALAVGVMIGGVLQLAVQVPALMRIGRLPRIALNPRRLKTAWQHEGVRNLVRRMGPAVLGVSVAPVSLMINSQIASHIAVGAMSWLTYADRLMELPTALLGIALSVVLTAQLAAAQGRGDTAAYSALLDWGLRLVLLLALPCAVALLVFAQPMVAVLYHRGAFQAADVQNTTLALMGYGVGLLGIIAVKVLAPAFYARQDYRTPLRISVISLVVTQGLNLLFVPRLGIAGLTLSIGVAALLNALLLFRGLRKLGGYSAQAGWTGFALRIVIGSALMGGLMWAAAHYLDWIALGATDGLRALYLAGVLVASAIVYFAALLLLGINLRQFAKRTA
ncbi:murein biosynthesis integral membrane protein MurJ [Roseateles toxinivorans]|uniref:Probable lipid II flippase MurJ n=1 Tax=Roseateles toxinivorans TaxID=270368 RepID=A0A4R6QJ19_9BURK|nr:murein biosynthesis integral membrane protein MurJ [Roseateles toxinivorans]TDP63071.1 putative peptidoglycan lipid II flippase [Roseateles toxinivorans]